MTPPTPSRHEAERFMRMALSLAMRGQGRVAPNPLVGCVIARGGDVLAVGWHARVGGPHAEAAAIADANARGVDLRGADVYVTLEPCSHTGRTPPCADALIAAGVARVFAGTVDPDPRVGGRGLERLRSAGIDVEPGLLEAECRRMNRGFISRVTRGRPWVTIKAAMGMDGSMAVAGGESKWITNEESRRRAHMLRADNDAVLAGVGTILRDDPALTVRAAGGEHPVRVVADSRLRTPPDAAVLSDGARRLILCSPEPDSDRARALEARGAEVVPLPSLGGRPEPAEMLKALAERGVNRLLIEGGAELIGAFIRAGLADEYSLFIAPKLLGRGANFSAATELADMSGIVEMKEVRTRDLSGDIWMEGVPACSQAL